MEWLKQKVICGSLFFYIRFHLPTILIKIQKEVLPKKDKEFQTEDSTIPHVELTYSGQIIPSFHSKNATLLATVIWPDTTCINYENVLYAFHNSGERRGGLNVT